LRPPRRVPTTMRRLLPTLALSLAAALVLAPIASADLLSPESGGSPNADDIDLLYWITFVIAVIVFVGVEGLLLYSMFKFKARKGAVAAQIRGNTRLEIGWTVGAAVILVILAVATFIKLDDIRTPPNSGPDGLQLADGVLVADSKLRLPPNGESLNVCVNGQQYVWRYTYANDCDNIPLDAVFSYEEMVVPVNTTVTLDIRAQDVIHSWWIPQLGGKFDATPGYTNYTWFKVPGKFAEPQGGTLFYGQCAEFCGRGHANMTALVRAVSVSDYQVWVDRQRTAIVAANRAAEQQRQQQEQQQQASDSATVTE
jgi:cytochrome c oxidase subunit 2